jgi:two-component system, OmpR family, response regulator QseB
VSRILVVEDDRGIRGMLERGLRLSGHETTMTEDLASARDAWTPGRFDAVLLDVMLPDGDGIDLLAERRATGDDTPAVLLTAREEADLRERADAAGASAYLPKPFGYADLLDCLSRLIR